jgi:myo-inositol-1(or 4)-monophosphatase
MASAGALEADWLAFSRRATEAARGALARFPERAERSRHVGRGEGGDMTLAIDGAVEDAIFAELESFGVGVSVVSEERGLVDIAGGGPVRLVIDPIDGSLNAKRHLPLYSISIAVADGDDMSSVVFGFVADLARGEEWWARHGEGACCNGNRIEIVPDEHSLEILGVEYTRPQAIAENAAAIAETQARRLRMLGSVALALCYVASGRFDGLITLRGLRSVDIAAGQLITREAGGLVAFPEPGYDGVSPGLDLAMRSSVLAATSQPILEALETAAAKVRR